MGKFLKNFGLGLVYILFFPVLLAAICVFGIYCLFVFFVELFIGTIRFFRGDHFFPPLKEDVMVEQIKQSQLQRQLNQTAAPQPQQPAGPSAVYVQQNYYQSHHTETPQGQNPIDTAGFFNNPDKALSNPSAPSIAQETAAPEIAQQKRPEASVIDISVQDGKKEG
jgi:hypothetical protein